MRRSFFFPMVIAGLFFASANSQAVVPLSIWDASLTQVNWDGCVQRGIAAMQAEGWQNVTAGGASATSQTYFIGGQHGNYSGYILCRPLGAVGSTYTVAVAAQAGTDTNRTRDCLANFMNAGQPVSGCGGAMAGRPISGGAPGGMPGGSQGCGDLSGLWHQSTPGIANTAWELTRMADGRYQASEAGAAHAQGSAVFSGGQLRIDWSTGPFSGYYAWNLDASCSTGSGNLVFFTGGSGSHASTVRRGN